MSLVPLGSARAAHVIANVEEKVNGEGPRGGAVQDSPDISQNWVVWWDARGTTTTVSGSSLWYKDLNTRTESRILELSTRHSSPRVSGDWVVWEDAPGDNIDIYARQLPNGPIVRVTDDPAAQYQPAIDGTKVVWQDDRNVTATGTDLYMKDLANLAQPEVTVTVAPGNQNSPEISGDNVVWTDLRNADDKHVRAVTATGVEFVVSDPEGLTTPDCCGGFTTTTAFDAAVSGNRVVWSEGSEFYNCGPDFCNRTLDLRTCEFPCTVSSTVWDSDDPNGQSTPDVSGTRVVWREGDGVFYRDLSGGGATLIDPQEESCGASPQTQRIDGTLTAWMQCTHPAPDIFWRDLATADPPARANSLGMGFFADQLVPAAGADFLVFRADANSADSSSLNTIWATDLRGDRRNFRVSSFDFQGEGGSASTAAGVGTAVTRPRISGNRVSWNDERNIPPPPPDPTGTDTFFRVLDPLGPETPVTSTVGIGNTPDIDGDRIVWLCSPTELCLHESGVVTRFTLPVTDPLIVDNLPVRISNDVVVWSQADLTGGCCSEPPTSTIHALDLTTGQNAILGSGANRPLYSGSLPGYDISGETAVWIGLDGNIYRNNVSFPCGPCDFSASATVFSAGSSAGTSSPQAISIDGTKVVWENRNLSTFSADIWLQDLGEATPHQLTDHPGDQMDPYVLGDYVYWMDSRNQGFGMDIFRESISGAGATLAPDSTAPGPVTGLTASSSGGVNTVSWTSPSNSDLSGVIVMRKTGLSPASGVDDPTAALVFDGLAASSQDSDVVNGVSYTYTAFTYDEVPNYSAGTSFSPPTPVDSASEPVSSEDGGTASTGTTATASADDPVEATVTVPPGSSSGGTTLTVTEFAASDPALPPEPSGFAFGGQVISVTTDPPVTFSPENPASLVLSYHDSVIPPGDDESALPIFTSEGGSWTPIGEPCTGGVTGTALSPDPCIASRDTTANQITIKTTHFSFFGIGIPVPPPPPPPPPALTVGYWLVASDGGIFAFGDAGFYGSTGAMALNKPIVGMASTKSGNGYWLVASDGGIFAFGDAGFYGSTGAMALNKPIVGMASTKSGNGYWLVASDGGIFSFGDAGFYGSTGAMALNKPIVGMASTKSGNGYWLVASDGGIFAFGDAGFYGSTGAMALNKPIVGMARTASGTGYWVVASDGGIFAFGDAPFLGSTGGMALNQPIVGMARRASPI